MKLKILNLIGEFLEEVLTWFTMKQITIFLVVTGLSIAILLPVLLRAMHGSN